MHAHNKKIGIDADTGLSQMLEQLGPLASSVFCRTFFRIFFDVLSRNVATERNKLVYEVVSYFR